MLLVLFLVLVPLLINDEIYLSIHLSINITRKSKATQNIADNAGSSCIQAFVTFASPVIASRGNGSMQ